MKAITILQPWAALIMCGAKKIETRSWATTYRGKIAIHAAKSDKYFPLSFDEPFKTALSPFWKEKHETWSQDFPNEWIDLDFGKVIAIADLTDCVKMIGSKLSPEGTPINSILENGMVITGNELTFGDYEPGRYAWILDNIQPIKPVPARGQQRLWDFNLSEV